MGRVGNEPGPHRFRHTYATDLFRRGVRLEVVLLYDAPRATGEM
jgi:site-specific recombinase XerD